MKNRTRHNGFTLIELIIVIVILGVLAVVASPRFLDFSSDAKVASLKSIASQMKSTVSLVQAKARVVGLRAVSTNPNAGQVAYVVDFGFGTAEVDFRNLCPESQAELGSQMQMLDFMQNSLSVDIATRVDNQYTLIGYTVPASGTPLNQGCYIIYDSFGSPSCTITVVTNDC